MSVAVRLIPISPNELLAECFDYPSESWPKPRGKPEVVAVSPHNWSMLQRLAEEFGGYKSPNWRSFNEDDDEYLFLMELYEDRDFVGLYTKLQASLFADAIERAMAVVPKQDVLEEKRSEAGGFTPQVFETISSKDWFCCSHNVLNKWVSFMRCGPFVVNCF